MSRSGSHLPSESEHFELPAHLKQGALYNDDLAPTPPSGRTWGTWNIASLWVGMVVCIPTYMLAASMIEQGMSWRQAILTVFLGNLIVLVPMVLNGVAGTRYGLSFPVLIRSSFGTVGTHVPSVMRALVACGWFGIQTWIGGAAIYQIVEALTRPGPGEPGLLGALPAVLPAWVGLQTGPAICFLVFWLINVWFIVRGTEAIKWLETLAAPFLLLIGLALLGWAVHAGGGFGRILRAEGRLGDWQSFGPVFWPNLTAMVGFWATLSLNIPDFTRYARSQRAQLLGQAIGLPVPMALFAFIGVAVTGATIVVFGEAIWDPVVLLGRFDSPVVVVISLFALALATLTTNIAANVVAPANSFSNLAPRWIGLAGGGLVAALLGIAIMPWKLLASAGDYVFTWLVGYSALLGPIAGVMIADYFVVQRGRILVAELYKLDGVYRRVNWRAMAALLVAILPNLPGFLAQVKRFPDAADAAHARQLLLDWLLGPLAGLGPARAAADFLVDLYPYAWFVGFGIAFVLHALIGRRVTRA